MKQIKQNVKGEVQIILVGNKCDLQTRNVSLEEGQQLAQTYKLSFYETSAKTGQNIEQAFTKLASQIIQQQKAEENNGTN